MSCAVIITSAACCLQTAACAAEPSSSAELIERARELDGKRVIYKGELVTAVLDRGEYSFVNLNDGSNAISVWCPSPALKSVRYAGSYRTKGDTLEVRGVFNRACGLHGGELDIHADEARLVKHGFRTGEKISRIKLNLTVAIFLTTLLIMIVFRRRL
jgi:hypothetical protein